MTKPPLRKLIRDFFLMGLISFGPGMFSIIYQRMVREREWMTEEQFRDGVTFSELAPGPFTLHVVMYVGYHLQGITGLLLATFFFSLPSIILVLLIAMLHQFFLTKMPGMAFFITGIWAAIFAAMISTILRIGKEVFQNPILITLSIAAFLAFLFFKVSFFLLIVFCGGIYLALGQIKIIREWQGEGVE